MKLNKLFIITIFALILLTSSVSATINWNTDVAMFLPLANVNNSATGLLDLSPNGLNGTAGGDAQFRNASQYAFDFDGVNDYVTFPDTNTINKSFCIWVNLDSYSTAEGSMLFDFRAEKILLMAIEPTGDADAHEGRLAGNDGTARETHTGDTVSLGTWTFICGVLDYENRMEIFYNGVSKQNSTIGTMADQTANNRMGTSYSGTYDLDGQLKSSYVFNRVLTGPEILGLFEEGLDYNPYASTPPVNTLDITAKDSRDNSAISNFSANVLLMNGTFRDIDYTNSSSLIFNITEDRVYDRYISWSTYNWTVPDLCLRSDNTVVITRSGITSPVLLCKKDDGTYLSSYLSWNWNDVYFWEYVDIGNYSTTNGTINTGLDETTYPALTIEISSDNYDNATYTNYNTSNDLVAYLNRTKYNITFTANNIITNTAVTGFNITLENGSSYNTTTIPIYNDFTTFNFSKTGYYNLSITGTIDQDKTLIFDDVYNSKLTLNIKDVLSGSLITANSTFNYTLGSYTNQATTTNGTIYINLLQGTYNTITWADDYAFQEENITTAYATTYNVSLYANNSLWIYAKDFDSSANLSNFEISLFNEANLYDAENATGEVIRLNNIEPAQYKLLVIKEGYSNAEYIVTIGDGSHQNITAYLLNSSTTDYTIFTMQNIVTTAIVPDVTVAMYKQINSTWVLVSSQNSDITGRIKFLFTPNIEYLFITSHEEYTQRTFLLKPLFTSYTVRLTPSDANGDYAGDWLYYINNSGIFYNEQTNPFTISIASGLGSLESYNLKVVNYDNTTYEVNCTNLYGCSDDFSLNISGATFNDVIKVNYTVDSSNSETQTYIVTYRINDLYSTNTIMAWGDNSDLDDLEKGIIFTVATLILVGVLAVVAISLGVSAVLTSGIGLVLAAYTFAFLGFIPMYAAHLIGLGAMLIIIFARGVL